MNEKVGRDKSDRYRLESYLVCDTSLFLLPTNQIEGCTHMGFLGTGTIDVVPARQWGRGSCFYMPFRRTEDNLELGTAGLFGLSRLRVAESDRQTHTYVVGITGKGKSKLLEHILSLIHI